MVKIATSRPTRIVAPNRAFDHIYDPVYTVPTLIDHQKMLRRSMVGKIERVPVWNNLFSEIGTFPSCGYRLSAPKAEPVINLNEIAIAAHHNAHLHVDTGGKDRYLFFNRPLIPFMQALPMEVIMSPIRKPVE